MHEDGIHLTLEEMAQTLYRAHAWASQAPESEVHPWEHLSHEQQSRYFAVAKKGPAVLERHEGESFLAISQALAVALDPERPTAEVVAEYNAYPKFIRLAAEALVRHLATLLDADEIDDLDALERSWGPWVKQRLGPQEVLSA